MNLSFAGCGFLGIYHVGVAVCFKKYAPHLLLDKISGASAGALAACCLLCDMPLGEMTSDFFRIVTEARSHSLGPFSPSFNIQTCLLEGLQKFLPPNAHLLCNGKLHISLTRVYDGKNVIVSQYNSREDLLQALLCACFIPMFSGLLPPRFHGIRYMDGAFSDNLPLLDENTVTVSPFCGESDICPRDNSAQMFHLNWANTSIEVSKQNMNRFARILFPPKPEILSNMCQRGFDDGLRFLHRNNLINCTRCLAVQSTFVVSESTEPAFDTGTERKNEETVIDNIEEYDPECKECVEYRKNAMRGAMPETVLSVFQNYIEQANKGLINWVFRHRSAKLLAAPLAVPADIFCATLTNIVGDQYDQQNFHYLTANTTTTTVGAISAGIVPNFLFNALPGRPIKGHCAHHHPVPSRFSHSHCRTSLIRTIGIKSTTNCMAQLLQVTNDVGPMSINADRIITMTPTLRHQIQAVTQYILNNIHNLLTNSKNRKKIANLSCQLAMTEYGQSVVGKAAEAADSGRLVPSNSLEFYNDSQITDSEAPHSHQHQHQHQADMDTFEHILDISSNQDAVYAYYYLDENNKVKVTEIFDCTDDPALMTTQEHELNQGLEFDSEWQVGTDSALLFADPFANTTTDQLMIDESEYSDIFSSSAPTHSHFRIEEITNEYDEDDKYSQPEADQESNLISDYVRTNLLSNSTNIYSLNNG